MAIYKLNPIEDRRWCEFLDRRPDASAFHTAEWLKTLQASYGYEPVVLTTCPPGSALSNGIVFCNVKSWITGTRWVSIPFADHCEPLFDNPDDLHSVLEWIAKKSQQNRVEYVEIRPINGHGLDVAEHTPFRAGKEYRLHLLDLRPTVQEILSSSDRSSVQRRLKHAARENLIYEEGIQPEILKKFYHLLVLTRKRHGVPPQPLSWFRNLVAFFGSKARVCVVSYGEVPIAGVLTLTHNGSVIYKYGGSDERHHNFGGMVALFWRSIQDAKANGAHTFDMGRSDLDNPGLQRFKSNWGTRELPLTYWRYPQTPQTHLSGWPKVQELGGNLLSHLPNSVLVALGNRLYRHAG